MFGEGIWCASIEKPDGKGFKACWILTCSKYIPRIGAWSPGPEFIFPRLYKIIKWLPVGNLTGAVETTAHLVKFNSMIYLLKVTSFRSKLLDLPEGREVCNIVTPIYMMFPYFPIENSIRRGFPVDFSQSHLFLPSIHSISRWYLKYINHISLLHPYYPY